MQDPLDRRARTTLLALLLLLAPAGALAADEKDEAPDDEGYVVFTKDHPLGVAEDGKALVYVLRPTSVGYAIKSFFIVDDTPAGINRGSSYFFTQVDPGKHVFWSKSENVDALELEVEAGKTYYIQQHVQIGGFRARTKLEVLDEEAGKAALAKCKKHGTMTARGRAKADEIVAEHKKDTQEDLDRRAEKATKGK
ncbi:MAG TPA: DUF2846 domain-containing protein [Candidatus Polarisedimenticolaceae bacterium]